MCSEYVWNVGCHLAIYSQLYLACHFIIFIGSKAASVTFDCEICSLSPSLQSCTVHFLLFLPFSFLFFLPFTSMVCLFLFRLFSSQHDFSITSTWKKKKMALLLCKQATVLCFIIHLISLYHFFFEPMLHSWFGFYC